MGRLDALKGKIEDWGYKDARRLASLRLDREALESKPIKSSIVEPDVDMVVELQKEVRIQSEEIVRLRRSVTLLERKRKPKGEF